MSSPVPFDALPESQKRDLILELVKNSNPEYFDYLEAILFPDDKEEKSEGTDFKNLSSETQKKQVLEYFAVQNDYVKTLDIAKRFYGPKASRKDINSILYSLQKDGKIQKQCEENGTNPKWKISS
jgi:hypothetical protein